MAWGEQNERTLSERLHSCIGFPSQGMAALLVRKERKEQSYAMGELKNNWNQKLQTVIHQCPTLVLITTTVMGMSNSAGLAQLNSELTSSISVNQGR